MEGAALLAAIWLQYVAPLRLPEAPALWVGQAVTRDQRITEVPVCVEPRQAPRRCHYLIFEGRKLIAVQPATVARCDGLTHEGG